MPSSTCSPITCHVLDSSLGKPATNIQVTLQKGILESGNIFFHDLSSSLTDADGRCSNLLEPGCLMAVGIYKVIFKAQDYFEASKRNCFYPFVEISFNLSEPNEHYHIPLLISPYSYTTYRGS